eukprot:2804098-Prymnesium_polylepis.2
MMHAHTHTHTYRPGDTCRPELMGHRSAECASQPRCGAHPERKGGASNQMSLFAGSVTFSEVSASDLAQTDSRSDSDPYVRWENADTGAVLAETHFLRNVLGRRGGRTAGSARTPRWDSEYSADLPLGVACGTPTAARTTCSAMRCSSCRRARRLISARGAPAPSHGVSSAARRAPCAARPPRTNGPAPRSPCPALLAAASRARTQGGDGAAVERADVPPRHRGVDPLVRRYRRATAARAAAANAERGCGRRTGAAEGDSCNERGGAVAVRGGGEADDGGHERARVVALLPPRRLPRLAGQRLRAQLLVPHNPNPNPTLTQTSSVRL